MYASADNRARLTLTQDMPDLLSSHLFSLRLHDGELLVAV